jgi:hypothetical protein
MTNEETKENSAACESPLNVGLCQEYVDQLKKDILTMVNMRDWVSFAELKQIHGFCGDRSLWADREKNLLIWVNVSQPAIDAINALVADNNITLRTGTFFSYLIDGIWLKFHLAKSAKRTYKKPHWIPTFLCKVRAPNAEVSHAHD